MKRFKDSKIQKIILSFLLIISFSLAVEVQAIDWRKKVMEGGLNKIGQEAYGASSDAPTDIRVVIAKIIRQILGVFGIILVILLVLGGFKYLKSQGNEDEIKESLATIKMAIIGLLIIIASFGIASFIISALK